MGWTKVVSGCLVRADALRPGDIFVARGCAKEGRWIAALSRGEGNHGHAGLILDQQHLFEANDDGVGATFFPEVWLPENGTRVRWVYVPYAREAFALLRHPQLAAQDQKRLLQQVLDACKKYEGIPYAKWPYLLEASRLSGFLKMLGRWWLQWRDPRQADSPLEGIFCSQLVVKVFRELGVELLGAELDHTVSPNMLANVKELQPVLLGEVLDEAQIRQRAPEISFTGLSEVSLKNRGKVKHLCAFNDSMAVMDMTLQRQRQDLESQRQKATEGFENLCRRTRQALRQQLQEIDRLADRGHYDRVRRFLKRFEELYPLARKYHAQEESKIRQLFTDDYYQLCLLMLRYQRYVTVRAMRAVRDQCDGVRGIRGLMRRRSSKKRQIRLARRLALIRGAILRLPQQRQETARLIQEAAQLQS